jgi:hypothetical protein
VSVEVLIEVLTKVIKAFRSRVRGVCCVPAVSSQGEFKVFNVLLAELVSSSACSLFPRDLSVGG